MSGVSIESTSSAVVITDEESGREVGIDHVVQEIMIEPTGPQGNPGPQATIATDLVAHYILAKS